MQGFWIGTATSVAWMRGSNDLGRRPSGSGIAQRAVWVCRLPEPPVLPEPRPVPIRGPGTPTKRWAPNMPGTGPASGRAWCGTPKEVPVRSLAGGGGPAPMGPDAAVRLAVRGDHGPASDIDLLVAFNPDREPGAPAHRTDSPCRAAGPRRCSRPPLSGGSQGPPPASACAGPGLRRIPGRGRPHVRRRGGHRRTAGRRTAG